MTQVTFTKQDLQRNKKFNPINKPPLLVISTRLEKGTYELWPDLDKLYTTKRVHFKPGVKVNDYRTRSARKIQASSTRKRR